MSNLMSDRKWSLIGAPAVIPVALYLRKRAARWMEPEGGTTVRFGDGQTGRMPPLGARFRASYRVGSGQAGNVGAIPHTPSVSRLRNILAEAEARAESADDDLSSSEVLRALLETIEREADKLQEELDDLYDDLFVETAEPWVLPYLGLFAAVVGIGSLGIAIYIRCRETT